MQLYLMMICGPVFACMLATYPWQYVLHRKVDAFSGKIARKQCELLAKVQIQLLLAAPFQPRLNCLRCGEPYPNLDHLKSDPSLPKTKVRRPMTDPISHTISHPVVYPWVWFLQPPVERCSACTAGCIHSRYFSAACMRCFLQQEVRKFSKRSSGQIKPQPDRCCLALQVCRGCRLVRYCSAECQLADWESHKPVCKHFSAPDFSAARQSR